MGIVCLNPMYRVIRNCWQQRILDFTLVVNIELILRFGSKSLQLFLFRKVQTGIDMLVHVLLIMGSRHGYHTVRTG